MQSDLNKIAKIILINLTEVYKRFDKDIPKPYNAKFILEILLSTYAWKPYKFYASKNLTTNPYYNRVNNTTTSKMLMAV